jgi:RNA polymerase sigma-70 factor (ECF subfamily)
LERVARAGLPDQAAWAEFVERYGRKVYQGCLRWKLQEADAQDVTQVVLLKLAVRMKEFRYDPARSFRAWLKTVAHHAWKDFVESKQRAGVAQGSTQDQTWLHTIEAREDLVKGLEEQFDLELLEQAMEAVRPRVAANNWRGSV